MSEAKFDEKYQKIFNDFKDHHKTEDYELDWIDEIYLPFWICKQELAVETEVKIDKFSKILLDLVDLGIKKHSEICVFLGIEEDDFTLMQLHFLINNDFLEENIDGGNLYYELTYEGRNFLDGQKEVLQNIQSIEYEYVINDLDLSNDKNKYQIFHQKSMKDFLDKNNNTDENMSEEFSGYKMMQPNQLKKSKKYKKYISHNDKPTLNKIENSSFVEFFSEDDSEEGVFYDFGSSIEAHQRSILFYFLCYKNKDGLYKVEIRHCKSSVKKFCSARLEKNLSKEVEKYVTENKDFVETLKNTDD